MYYLELPINVTKNDYTAVFILFQLYRDISMS